MPKERFEVWTVCTDGHANVIGRLLWNSHVELVADTPEQFARNGIRIYCLSMDVSWYDNNDEELQPENIVERDGCIVSFTFEHVECAPLERGMYVEFIRVQG